MSIAIDSARGQRPVSGLPDGEGMSRRARQRVELQELCRSGSVSRAVDLAFAHFADFGQDEEILVLLAEALDRTPVTAVVWRRLAELQERA
jgi:hypothetical protein